MDTHKNKISKKIWENIGQKVKNVIENNLELDEDENRVQGGKNETMIFEMMEDDLFEIANHRTNSPKVRRYRQPAELNFTRSVRVNN